MSNMITLSKETIEVLAKANRINSQIRLRDTESTIIASNPNMGFVMFAPIVETFPREVNIYEIRAFLSILKLFDEPRLDLSNPGHIVIKSKDGTQKTTYHEAEPSMIKDTVKSSNFKFPATDVTIAVSAKDFERVNQATASMGQAYIGFFNEDQDVFIAAFNRTGDGTRTDVFSIKLEQDTFDLGEVVELDAFYSLEKSNIALLAGEGDLMFEINAKKASLISTRMTEKDRDLAKRFVSGLDHKSSIR